MTLTILHMQHTKQLKYTFKFSSSLVLFLLRNKILFGNIALSSLQLFCNHLYLPSSRNSICLLSNFYAISCLSVVPISTQQTNLIIICLYFRQYLMLHLVNRDFIKSQKWNKQILNIHRPHLLAIGKSIVDMMYLFRVNHMEDTSRGC